MPDVRSVCKDEQVYTCEGVHGMPRGAQLILACASILLFFILPRIIQMSRQAISVWVLMCGGIFLALVMRYMRRYRYCIGVDACAAYDGGTGRLLWKISGSSIQQIRVETRRIVIHVPKKMYVVYTGDSTDRCAEELRLLMRRAIATS